MAKKRQTLKTAQDISIPLLGISCHLKSYRLSFALNKALNFKFRRIDDFVIPGQTKGEFLSFPFLVYESADLKNHFCLVGNHHPEGKLLPALREVDYFLMAREPLDDFIKAKILAQIRSIPQVIGAYEVDPSRTKDMGLLMEEMEMHLLEAGRKTSPHKEK